MTDDTDLRKLIAKHAEQQVSRWSEEHEDEVRDVLTDPEKWQQDRKRPLSAYRDDHKSWWEAAMPGLPYEDTWTVPVWVKESGDSIVLDPQPLTEDCLVREFNQDDQDQLDCLVVTDPKDERVLLLIWHCD